MWEGGVEVREYKRLNNFCNKMWYVVPFDTGCR